MQHAGEVYGEKSMLATESRELQSRLAKLKAENEKAFSAINEVCVGFQQFVCISPV